MESIKWKTNDQSAAELLLPPDSSCPTFPLCRFGSSQVCAHQDLLQRGGHAVVSAPRRLAGLLRVLYSDRHVVSGLAGLRRALLLANITTDTRFWPYVGARQREGFPHRLFIYLQQTVVVFPFYVPVFHSSSGPCSGNKKQPWQTTSKQHCWVYQIVVFFLNLHNETRTAIATDAEEMLLPFVTSLTVNLSNKVFQGKLRVGESKRSNKTSSLTWECC